MTTLNPTLHWHAVTGATITGYQINLHDITTDKTVSFKTGVSVDEFKIPSTATLSPANKYVWNVRVLNGTESGPPSHYLYFQTESLPRPEIISPGTTAAPGPTLTTLTPTLAWHAITGVHFDCYQFILYVSNAKKLKSIQVSPTATSYTLPAGTLIPGHSYIWNLRLKVGDITGPESTTYLNSTPAPAAVIVCQPRWPSRWQHGFPRADGDDSHADFDLEKVTDATITGYLITLHDQTTDKTVEYTTGISVDQFTIPSSAKLTAGDKYVWNVRVLNGTKSGPPSEYLYFQEAPSLPRPVIVGVGSTTAPGTVLTTLTPTLTWDAVTGVTFDSYQINLYDITTKTLTSIQVGPHDTHYTIPAGTLVVGDSVTCQEPAAKSCCDTTVTGKHDVSVFHSRMKWLTGYSGRAFIIAVF